MISNIVNSEILSQILDMADVLQSNGNSTQTNFKDLESSNRVSLFFINVFSVSKKKKYLNFANKCAELSYANFELNPNNLSFIGGGSGLIYVYIKLYEETGNFKYLENSFKIIDKSANYYVKSPQVGNNLYHGRAGLLLMMLYLYDKTKESSLLEWIYSLSTKIISNAFPLGGGLAWYNPFDLVIKPRCSLGYGAAGIGFVFNLLGQYFRNNTFKEVAKNAFLYVNNTGYDKERNLWNNFGKNINNKEDQEEHIAHFLKKDDSFFLKPQINHSISCGAAGILYSQLKFTESFNGINYFVKDNLKTLPKSLLYDLAHIGLEVDRSTKNFQIVDQKILIELINKLQNENNDLDLAVLKISLLKNETCLFNLPKIILNEKPLSKIDDDFFLSRVDVYKLLIKKSYPKSFLLINQFDGFKVEDLSNRLWSNQEAVFLDFLASKELSKFEKDILKTVFEYEKDLYNSKLKFKQNPYFHIKEFIELRDRMDSLKINNTELINKKLILSKKFSLKENYISKKEIEDFRGEKNDDHAVFWKFDIEEGVKELDIRPIKFVLEGFEKSKYIKDAFKEFKTQINSFTPEELRSLLIYSNSINKSQLFQRLPFIYLYFIKILISEGILEFTNT